eukprot:TRINITY_DN2013_c0_g1_i1.p1 TRINITY_DN2013_c0_g1~~TRINITY_DN2013_c0_g1_i1.p1  ORF type:complete len:2987 (-),score=636.60 TRINITY_DN2013_c0_g1_i1:70-9030(-)
MSSSESRVLLRRWTNFDLSLYETGKLSPDRHCVALKSKAESVIELLQFDSSKDGHSSTVLKGTQNTREFYWLGDNKTLVLEKNSSVDVILIGKEERSVEDSPITFDLRTKRASLNNDSTKTVKFSITSRDLISLVAGNKQNETQDVKLLGPYNKSGFVILCGSYLYIFLLTESDIVLKNLFKLPKGNGSEDHLHLQSFLPHNNNNTIALSRGYLFFIVNYILYMWDLSSQKQLIISLDDIKDSQKGNVTDIEVQSTFHIDITDELSSLIVLDTVGKMHVFNLDELISKNPSINSKISEDCIIDLSIKDGDTESDEEEEEEEAETKKSTSYSQFLHWYENPVELPVRDLTPSWIPKTTSYDRNANISFSMNGFNKAKQTQQVQKSDSVLQKQNVVGSPSFSGSFSSNNLSQLQIYDHSVDETHKKITNFMSSPLHIVVSLLVKSNEGERIELVFVNRRTMKLETFSFPNDFIVLPSQSSLVPFFLSKDGMGVILVDENQDKLTNKMIIFHGPSQAEALYAVNGWERRSLRLHALDMGLKFRQLDVVKEALQSLDSDQEFTGAKILLDFAKSIKPLLQDQGFLEQLFQIAIQFVSSAILKLSQLLSGDECNKLSHASDMEVLLPRADSNKEELHRYNQIHSFSLILARLQHHKATLRDNTISAAASNVPLRVQSTPMKSKSKNTSRSRRILFSSSSSSSLNSLVNDLGNLLEDGVNTTSEYESIPEDMQENFRSESDSSYQSNNSDNSQVYDDSQLEIHVSRLDKVNLSDCFGNFKEKWEKMSDLQLIKYVLTKSSNISLALSFIRWRTYQYLEKSDGIPWFHHHTKNFNNDENLVSALNNQHKSHTIDIPDLEYFLRLSRYLIYQSVTNNDIKTACGMVLRLGQSINEHFHQIAWRTSRRNVRNSLLLFLRRTGGSVGSEYASTLTQDKLEIIKWANLIEEFYANSDYTVEYSRRLNEQKSTKSKTNSNDKANAQLPLGEFWRLASRSGDFQLHRNQDLESNQQTCSDLDDMSPKPMSSLGFEFGQLNSSDIEVPSMSSSIIIPSKSKFGNSGSSNMSASGYSHFRLEWIQNWSADILYRILMESVISNGIYQVERLNEYFRPPNWFVTQFQYFISHNDLGNIIKWIKSIDTQGYTVDELGRLVLKSKNVTDSFSSSGVNLFDLVNTICNEMNFTSDFIAQFMMEHFASKGIFLVRNKEPKEGRTNGKTLYSHVNLRDGKSASKSYFESIMRLLASTGKLFDTRTNVESELSLDELLPIGQLSPFHLFFIEYCIKENLHQILATYLDTYQLLLTQKQIHDLHDQTGLGRSAHIGLNQFNSNNPSSIDNASKSFNPTSHVDTESELWFSLLSLFRTKSNHYISGLLNAQLIMKEKKIPTINSIMTEKSIQKVSSSNTKYNLVSIALSIIAYLPLNVKDAMSLPVDASYHISSEFLKQSLQNYPQFYQAIFAAPQKTVHVSNDKFRLIGVHDIKSSHNDTDLSVLLRTNPVYSFDKVLPKNPSEQTLLLCPTFDSPIFNKDRYENTIDISYYLANGQPFHAYSLLAKQVHSQNQKIFQLSRQQKIDLLRTVRITSLRALSDPFVLSSCSCFLEQCKLDTELFRIHIAAAQRIFKHRFESAMARKSEFTQDVKNVHIEDGESDESIIDETDNLSNLTEIKANVSKFIAELFVQLPEFPVEYDNQRDDNNSVTSISQEVLTLLIESTIYELNKNPTSNQNLQSGDNAWVLLADFSRIHGLEMNTKCLEQIALQDDWISYLYFAQSLKYPKKTVLEIAKFFKKQSLRDHIRLCLTQFNQPPSEESFDTLGDSDDLFHIVLNAEKRFSNISGLYLLYISVKLQRPLLSIVAGCFSDVTPLMCMICWLYSALPVEFDNEEKLPSFVRDLMSLKSTQELSKLSLNNDTNLKELSQMILYLSTKNQFVQLIKAMDLFSPSHLLTDWLKFSQAFQQSRFEDAKGHFSAFVKLLRSPDFPVILKIGDAEWSEVTATKIADEFILRSSTEYEKGHLLSILSLSNFSTRYTKLNIVFKLLQRTGLSDSLSIQTTLPDPVAVIELLLSKNLYVEARAYALASKLDRHYLDQITRRQVKSEVIKRKEALKWSTSTVDSSSSNNNSSNSSSLIVNNSTHHHVTVMASALNLVWDGINSIFLQHKCSPLVVADFFLEEAQSLATTSPVSANVNVNGSSNSSAQPSPQILIIKERIKLLSLSLEWLNGTHNDSVGLHPLSEGAPLAGQNTSNSGILAKTWKSQAFLSSLDSKILELSVQAEIESMTTTSSTSTTQPQQQNTSTIDNNNSFNFLKQLSSENDPPPTIITQKPPTETPKEVIPIPIKENSLQSKSLLKLESLAPLSQSPSSIMFNSHKNSSQNMIDIVIGRLLNEGNIVEAGKVCKQFNHESLDYELITNMISISKGTLAVKFLDEKIKSALSDWFEIESASRTDLLNALAKLCKNATKCAAQIVILFKVAQLLATSYDELCSKDPYQVLEILLIQVYSNYALIKQFIEVNSLDRYKVASILASHCVKSISVDLSSNNRYGTPKPTNSTNKLNINPSSMASLSGTSSVPNTPTKLKKNYNSVPFSPGGASDFSVTSSPPELPSTPSSTSTPATGNNEKSDQNLSSGGGEFLDFISITKNPSDVGTALLAHLNDPENDDLSYAIQVEILVHAHYCYLVSANLSGIDTVLDIIKQKVNDVYYPSKQFKLLVRLLTGTKQYTNLEYCLELLIQADQFEMILGKSSINDDEGKRELQIALYHFLKSHHQEDKLKMLFLRFNMYRELAELLHEKAKDRLKKMKTTQQLDIKRLLEIMEKLIHAAAYYAKAECYSLENDCYNLVELISLQIENPDTLFVNLEKTHARQFMCYLGIFEHTLTLAKAYNLNELSEWVGPIYQQVIENGNFGFLCDYSGVMPLSPEFFQEIVRKWKSNTQLKKKQHITNMHSFLMFLDDHYLRYEIATSLGPGFSDVTSSLQNLPGLQAKLSKVNTNINVNSTTFE